MAKISKDRLKRYRELAHIASMEMKNPGANAIYNRMHKEGAPVMLMRDSDVGMYMAPFRQALDQIDIESPRVCRRPST